MTRFSLSFLVLLSDASSYEQTGKTPGSMPRRIANIPSDTTLAKSDTLRTAADSVSQQRKSEIETTITYSARDSINSRVDRKIVYLYGDAKIKYGDIELMAEEIVIDYEKSTISAQGKLDSLGRRVGYPVFINGSEKYETKTIDYNFKNRRARISEVVTKQDEGFLHGKAVIKNEKNELLSVRNAYTTCNLAHPHYQIIASKAKAIPGDKMVVGPFHMEINDVPLPLGFPFGIFPSPRSSASGIIVPSYGEEKNRGFFLRNGGYFFDLNDYIKLQVTGDLYSKGSSAMYVNSNYIKRYKYSGTFNFSYSNNRVTESIEDKSTVQDFRIAWSHTPQSKGTGRFSASVNAASATFNTNNLLAYNTNPSSPRLDNTTRKLSSNISYSKTFGKLINIGSNFRINQDLTTKQVDLALPDLTLNVNNVYPLKKSEGMFFQNLSVRLSSAATNQITNNLGRNFKNASGQQIQHDSIAPFNGQTFPTLFEQGKKGIRHNVPVSTSFKVLNFFTISPGVSFDELWYFEKLTWGTSADNKTAVVTDTLRGFNRVFNYSGNVSMTTRIYGTYFFKGKSGVQAIRHIINPTVSMTYQPDFGDPSYGYYQKLQLQGNPSPVYKSVHEGFVYGSSRFGESATMGFGVNNTMEMKVKSKKDTVARKVSLFNTLSINSGYNFRADSFKLAPFSMAANTNVLDDKLNINMTASLDPYKHVTIAANSPENSVPREIRTRHFAWNPYTAPAGYHVIDDGFGIGRITNAALALSTNLSPKGKKKDADTRSKIGQANIPDADKKYLLQNPDTYIDFNIPWNLRINYNIDYNHGTNSAPTVTQAMRFNGDFSLSQQWKVVLNSGYDFEKNELTQTYVTISRDLHCWQVNLSWVPFGKYTSYTFFIGIKSSILKDLRLNRTRSFFDN
ncbi:MAG: putative LPS assembly protein LptD [Cytophagales bacterium]|nr:putative LPS assembly protein LptD [Cytophagales bacterium]